MNNEDGKWWFRVWRTLLVLSICGMIVSIGRVVGANSDTFMVSRIEGLNCILSILFATCSVRIKSEDVG